jgi:hypothetical protein
MDRLHHAAPSGAKFFAAAALREGAVPLPELEKLLN